MTIHSASPCPAKLSASTRTSIGFRARAVGALGLATLGLLLAPATARAQSVPTVFVANYNAGTVSTYTTSGSLLNANFITGLSGPTNIAISGSDLYVSNSSNSTIGKYTIVSGTTSAVQNASFITNTNGLNDPRGLVVSGSNLFVANLGTGVIQNYATSGSFVSNVVTVPGANGAGLTGLALSGTSLYEVNTYSLNTSRYSTSGGAASFTISTNQGGAAAVSGSSLFVALQSGAGANTVRTFDLTTGAAQSTISGLSGPTGLAVFGTSLFVVNNTNGSLGAYDFTNSSYSTLVSGLSGGAYGIAVANVSAIPEPSTYAALAGVAALGLAFWRKRRNPVAGAAK